MIKLTIVYYNLRDGETFDADWYYRRPTAHALSFVGRFGCRRLEVSTAILNIDQRLSSGWPENIRRTTELWFDTQEEAVACIYSKEMHVLDSVLFGGTSNVDTKRKTTVERGIADTVFTEVDSFEFDREGRLIAVDGPWAEYFSPYLGTFAPPALPVEEVPNVPQAR